MSDRNIEKTLNQLGIDTVGELREYVYQIESFASEEVPAVIEEMLRWGMVVHGTGTALFGMAVAAFSVAAAFFFRRANRLAYEGKGGGPHESSFILSFCIATGSLAGLIYHGYTLLHVLVAPRLYLIQELGNMIQ